MHVRNISLNYGYIKVDLSFEKTSKHLFSRKSTDMRHHPLTIAEVLPLCTSTVDGLGCQQEAFHLYRAGLAD